VVGIGNRPIPVSEKEIEDLRRVQDSGMPAEPCPFLEFGREVVVVGGPLKGLRGLVLQHDGPECLILSVTLLQRSVRIRLHPKWAVATPSGVGGLGPIRQNESHKAAQ
jgi:transcription antitermination factor NusG